MRRIHLVNQLHSLRQPHSLSEAASLSGLYRYWGLTKWGSLTQFGKLTQFNNLTQWGKPIQFGNSRQIACFWGKTFVTLQNLPRDPGSQDPAFCGLCSSTKIYSVPFNEFYSEFILSHSMNSTLNSFYPIQWILLRIIGGYQVWKVWTLDRVPLTCGMR